MDTLKDFIEENKSSIKQESLEKGDIERFLKKAKNQKRKIVYRWVAYPLAAALLLVLTLPFLAPSRESESIRIYKEYCREVGLITSELQILSSEEERIAIERDINIITFEAIPLYSQLPEEMSEKEKAKLIKEYYSQKIEGVKRLKFLVANSDIEE